MSTTVTLNLFSGRPNPTWTLSDSSARELESYITLRGKPSLRKARGALGHLGYRGFSVTRGEGTGPERLEYYLHENVVDLGGAAPSLVVGDRELEHLLLDTGAEALDGDIVAHVRRALEEAPPEGPIAEFALQTPTACPACVAVDAPIYSPGLWNIPNVQPFNNCYNYANDHITNTFAQPGRAHNAGIVSLNCAGTTPSAVADGLASSPNFSVPLAANGGWYVALVIWPGQDYHWYRQDVVGCWSHKPGQTASRNYDNSGNNIADPQLCDRGPYTDFCGYMKTNRSVVIR